MKRRREDNEADDGGEVQRKRREVASAGGGAAEQRSGVVTVGATADTFKPTPPRPRRHATPPTPSDHIARNRCMASMVKVAERMFLTPPSREDDWGKECAVMASIFYFALVHPTGVGKTFLHSIIADFAGRWLEELEGSSLDTLLETREEHHKCGAFTTLLLLHANLLPDVSISLSKLRTLPLAARWHEEVRPPEWLLTETSCTNSLLPFNATLLMSAELLQEGLVGKWPSEITDTYMGMLARLFYAVALYREGNFIGCLHILDEIPSTKCDTQLQGHVLWLTGLSLAKLEKPHMARLKLEAAVKESETCLPAVFNISSIFYHSNMVTAELECLSLLAAAGGVEDVHEECRLQASLIRLHQATPSDLPLRALNLLAGRCLQLKMVKEASNKFSELLEKLETVPKCRPPTATLKTWLRKEDEIPEVPFIGSVKVQAAVAHLEDHCVQMAFDILLQLENEDLNLGTADTYKQGKQEKLITFTTAAGYLAKIDSLVKLGKELDALKECVRLEQALSWVRYVNISDSSGWELMAIMMKALLYTWLSHLHGIKANKQNQSHYRRRAAQCASMLQEAPSTLKYPELACTESITIENIYCYLKSSFERLSAREAISKHCKDNW